MIIIHALIDFAGFVTSDGTVATSVTTSDLVVSALYIVMFTAYGIVMMRSLTHQRTDYLPGPRRR